jgi:hypothetical protein
MDALRITLDHSGLSATPISQMVTKLWKLYRRVARRKQGGAREAFDTRCLRDFSRLGG